MRQFKVFIVCFISFILSSGIYFLSGCDDEESTAIPTPTPSPDYDMATWFEMLEIDKYMDIDYTSHSPKPGDDSWEVYYYDTSDCKCILGSEFYLSVRQGTESNNVIFYMEGGGACWPGMDFFCSTTAGYGGNGGIKSTSDLNPLKDWNVVHIPYCDGSVHSGDNDADYNQDGEIDHWHWGMRHLSAGTSVMLELFPNPDKILVCGSSAGGFGTFFGYMVVKMQYPDTPVYIYNDAGPGVFNPDKPETYELIQETWGFMEHIPYSCYECDEQLIFLYDWFLDKTDDLKICLFTAYEDQTIGGIFLGMFLDEYAEMIVNLTDQIIENHPNNFKRFLVDGSAHTAGSVGYTYEVEGTSIYDWVGMMVNDDPDWDDLLE